MGRLTTSLTIVLIALAVDAGNALRAADDQPPEPIATRQTIFSIPFQIEKASTPGQEPVEVDLYVSTDRGANWRPYAKVEPSQGYFLFRAVGDGEYWFLVRTLDRMGQLKPQAPPRPELCVMVDTTPPTLQLQADRGDAGQIVTEWKIGELALSRDTFKIQYRTDTDPTWQSVAVDWRNVEADGPRQSGKVIWWPPAGANRLEIRAEVNDLAGNAAVSHQQVHVKPAEQTAPGPALNDPINATAQRWRPAKRDEADSQWTATSPSPETSVAGQTPKAASDGVDPAPQSTVAAYPRTRTPDATASRFSAPPTGSVAGSVNPAIQNQYLVPGVQPPATTPWPAGVRPRIVNSRVFELDYALPQGSVMPSGPVQIWGTRDGGRTWESFGQDADGRSPAMVTVREEGAYGFCVSAPADPRAAPVPPPAGQQPDSWVSVDFSQPSTPPAAWPPSGYPSR